MSHHIKLLAVLVLTLSLSACAVYEAPMGERSLGTYWDDVAIVTAIEAEFFDDDFVNSFDISPYSYDGHVVLVGEYDVPEQKSRAIAIAEGVSGVRSVSNFLLPEKKGDICGYGDDTELVARVRADLVASDTVSLADVDVTVVQCHIVLMGVVGQASEIDAAKRIASAVAGVRSVESFLWVMR